jgi:uncharacterized membrane protein YphA (DoxX/SURF4 family)
MAKRSRSIVKLAGLILLWLVSALTALQMLDAGWGKFESAEGWQHWMVEVWGYPSWFRTFIGLAEMAGGALLLWPRTASWAATGLIVIMLGAFWTVTTKPSDLSSLDPVINIALLLIVCVGWWPRRIRRCSRQSPPSGADPTSRG